MKMHSACSLLFIFLAFAIVQAGCSDQSRSSVDSRTGAASREEPVVASPASEIELWVRADENPPYAFGVAGGRESTGEIRVVILEVVDSPGGLKHRPMLTSKGVPADFAVALVDFQGQPLLRPNALLAVRDHSNEVLQRLFVVFDGTIDGGAAHAVGEVLINLNGLESGRLPVTAGRVFSLPVRGSLGEVNLSAGPADSRLTVNVPAPAGDPSQPVIFVYDISSDATMLDPVDILTVPAN